MVGLTYARWLALFSTIAVLAVLLAIYLDSALVLVVSVLPASMSLRVLRDWRRDRFRAEQLERLRGVAKW